MGEEVTSKALTTTTARKDEKQNKRKAQVVPATWKKRRFWPVVAIQSAKLESIFHVNRARPINRATKVTGVGDPKPRPINTDWLQATRRSATHLGTEDIATCRPL